MTPNSVIAVLASVVFASVASAQDDPETSKRVSEARAKGGLRAAAAVTGTYLTSVNQHCGPTDTVETLVDYSSVIVVGRIASNRCWLNAKGELITTDYEVVVEQSLKGWPSPADRLTMSVAGGRLVFEDGSVAEVISGGMALPLKDETYILFLSPTQFHPGEDQKAAANGLIYMLSFGSKSLYHINSRGRLESRAVEGHPLHKTYNGNPENQLIYDVLSLVLSGRD